MEPVVPFLFRRLFGGRPLGPRLRRRWEYTRPFPLPHYTAGTPKISGTGPYDLFLPPNAATLGAAVLSQEAKDAVAAVLAKMTQLDEMVGVQVLYQWSREKFGPHWRHADLLTALWAAVTINPPATYLEIGVRTGRSVAVVGATAPECAIYGFDLWIPEYGDSPNPGPDFVREELRKVGHTGSVTLLSGDSRETLPAFLREHPDLYFDLIVIDGDKSIFGAGSDYANALPRLKVGGIVVSDDIGIKRHLRRVWETVVSGDARYRGWQFSGGLAGVAAAVRVSDEPVLPYSL